MVTWQIIFFIITGSEINEYKQQYVQLANKQTSLCQTFLQSKTVMAFVFSVVVY